jgi:hypothetical protein
MVLTFVHDPPAPGTAEPVPGAALIVPLVAGNTADPSRAEAIASLLLEPVAARFGATLAAPCDMAETESHVQQWLSQAPRLLLLPFGRPSARWLPSLVESLQRAVAAATGQEVTLRAFPTPAGAVTRPLFAPLEGVASAEAQLTPLLRLFPGWPGQFLCLSSGEAMLALFCDPAGGEEQGRRGKEALAVKGLLEIGLGLRAGGWRGDGELFVSYVQSLVGAVLRGPVLQCADTLQNNALLHLLTPPD